jgi:hypothetical protein
MRAWMLASLLLLVLGCREKAILSDGANGQDETRSGGIIPLQVGNWWDYHGHRQGVACAFRRRVCEKRTIQGLDYYVLVDSMFETGATDTVCLMRNVTGLGVVTASYTSPNAADADTLFQYGGIRTGSQYWFHQDSVVVLYGPPGGPLLFSDSLYRVFGYQRFVLGGLWPLSYVSYLRTDSIGMLEEYLDGDEGYWYGLMDYYVQR